jgi:PAS domain S-box-containing protein
MVLIRYSMGFPGALGTCISLFLFSRHAQGREFRLIYAGAGVLFFVYALVTGIVVPQSVFFPSTHLNDASFLAAVHMPIQFVRAVIATLIAFLFIFKVTKMTIAASLSSAMGSRHVRSIVTTFLLLYSAFIIFSFNLINKVEHHEKQHLYKIMTADAKILADALGVVDSDIFSLRRVESLYPQYRQIHRRLTELADMSSFVKALYLVGFKDNAPYFVVGSLQQVFPQDVTPSFRARIPKKTILDAFHSKQPTIHEPRLSGRPTYAFSIFVPISDVHGVTTLLLGVDLDNSKIKSIILKARLEAIFVVLAFLVLLIMSYSFLLFFSLKNFELELQKTNLNKALVSLKETEAELARSEETFRGILNNSPNPIFGFDRDLRLIFWNHGAEVMYGYDKAEVVDEKDPLLSKKIPQLLGIEKIEREIEKVFLGNTFIWEMVHKTKDARIDVSMTVFPVKDPKGHILFGIGLTQDISEHKRFEEKLSDAHSKIKTVLDGASHVAMIATDMQGLISVFNSGAERMLGYTVEEVVGKMTPLQFHPEPEMEAYKEWIANEEGRPTGIFEHLKNLYANNSEEQHEWTWIRKDGIQIPIDISLAGLKNEKGEVIGFLGVAIDLSKRKAAEAASFESENKFKELTENLKIGLFKAEVSENPRYVEANNAYVEMLECSSLGELLGMSIAEIVDSSKKDKISALREFNQKVMTQGFLKNEEVEALTRKGNHIWLSYTAKLIRENDGRNYLEGIVQDITEQKNLETKLMGEQARLRTIATSIGAGLSLVDRDFKIVWVNETLEKWFGDLLTIKGRKCYETYQFKNNICDGCPSHKAMQTGEISTAEQHVIFPSGKVMDFLLICSPIKNERGEVEQVLELTLDMTDRYRTIELLEYERALSKNVIDSISDSLIVLDCNTRMILDANRMFLEEVRLKKEDVVGKRCEELKSHLCPPCEACGFDKVVKEGKTVSATHVHETNVGQKAYVDVTLSPLRDEKGQMIGVIHLAKNVTDRKLLEDELRRYSESLESLIRERTSALQTSELMFRKLFEAAQDGIMIVDAETNRVIDINPYLLSLFECSREDIQGLEVDKVGCFVGTQIYERVFEELKNNISVFLTDCLMKTCSGREIFIEFGATLYFVENRKVIQCNIRDITEKKKLDQVKTEFVSMVSHELRTPLSAIKEGVEIVSDGTQGHLNKSQKECLGIALSNIKRLNRLIGDILDISKIQSDLLKIKLVLCDVYEVVEHVYSLVRIEIEKRGMIFVTDLANDLPPVRTDKDRLIQIILNLLNNAVKFTREKSKITLSCRQTGPFVEFGVRDEGAGIPSDDLARLFGKFVQLDSSLIRRVGGTGLGLYISRNLVEAMGGTIWAESKVGEGSVFKFTMPI